jgi:mannose-1-phosphate guanylyltransferase
MAGGIGNRFWPVSNRRCPKQFSDILHLGKSFIRQTYERIAQIFPNQRIFIVTSVEYEEITKKQIPELPDENILKEPYGRNTATCIAYASYKIHQMNPDAYLVTLPSDHFICNDSAYLQNLKEGVEFVEKQGGLLTVGITPTRAETEYGYIQVKSKDNTQKISAVKTFTEKPNLELARMFFDSDEFLWNAGIFIWKATDIIQEFKTHMYDLHLLFTTDSRLNTPGEAKFIQNVYGQCHNISIDVGIMEKSQHVFVLKGNFGWSDVGTWHAFHALCDKDENQNVSNSAKVILNDSHNCIVNVPSRKNVIIQGVDQLIIAEKNNYLMICHRKDEDKIKRFEKQFRIKNKGD